jgi:hypothetical protein
MRTLFRAAGYQLVRLLPPASPFSILEGVPIEGTATPEEASTMRGGVHFRLWILDGGIDA